MLLDLERIVARLSCKQARTKVVCNGELGDDGSVALVSDGCVPRVVNVVADGDHNGGRELGGERGC